MNTPTITSRWTACGESILACRWILPFLLVVGGILSFVIPSQGLLNNYGQLILATVGINIILTVSLNLVNGYMGEFSVGHAGFMAVGAYISAFLTVKFFPYGAAPFYGFPAAVLAGGIGAAVLGLIIAALSFKTRGDYLAIVTLAFTMIVKSVLENIDAVGGALGLRGIEKLTTLPWVYFWTVSSVWIIRNLVYSRYGRGILTIREDEIAANLMGVNTRQAKVLAFVVSSFFAGVAGGLFAHQLQFINPSMFNLIKSTDILVMVYLGGVGSLAGSVLSASLYTVLLEALRPLGIYRMMFMPLMLILLMLFRPRGIMGLRELAWFVPKRDLDAVSPDAVPPPEIKRPLGNQPG